jgi:hypothetical protein
MMRTLTEDECDQISHGNCPSCGKRGFVIGPQGGRSINIECASLDCRSRFNIAFHAGFAMMGQRIDRGGPWPSEPNPDEGQKEKH